MSRASDRLLLSRAGIVALALAVFTLAAAGYLSRHRGRADLYSGVYAVYSLTTIEYSIAPLSSSVQDSSALV